jgi:hypothetical protein
MGLNSSNVTQGNVNNDPERALSFIKNMHFERIVAFSEFSESACFYSPIIKTLQGREQVTYRNLYEAPKQGFAGASLLFIGNTLVQTSNNDLYTNIAVLETPFSFTHNENIVKGGFYKKANKTLENELFSDNHCIALILLSMKFFSLEMVTESEISLGLKNSLLLDVESHSNIQWVLDNRIQFETENLNEYSFKDLTT